MDENGEPLTPPDDDRTPTQEDAPQPTKGPGWVMPEPVFRKSTGYLPKGVEERFRQSLGKDASDNVETGAEPVEGLSAGVAAQPLVGDDEAVGPTASETSPPPKKKRSLLRILLIILGLLLAAAAVTAIAAAGLIWYVFQPSESQTF